MNAGAFGFEIWSLVESVTTINTLGEVFKRSVTEFDIAYRKVVPQHKGPNIKIGCWLFFKKSDNALSVSGVKKSCAMPPTLNEQCLAIGWL
jgi:UDP-N-acetylenolpyruvoylglucosamine reductase